MKTTFLKLLLLAALACGALRPAAHAAIYTWNSPNSGTWGDPLNWAVLPGGPPLLITDTANLFGLVGADLGLTVPFTPFTPFGIDSIVIGNAPTDSCTLFDISNTGSPPTGWNLLTVTTAITMNDGRAVFYSTMIDTPLLTVNGGNLEITDTNVFRAITVDINNGGVLCAGASAPGGVVSAGNWNVNVGGTLNVRGTIIGSVNLLGGINGGCSIGTAIISGSLVQSPSSTTTFELDTCCTVGGGVNDLISVIGNPGPPVAPGDLTLDGTLNVIAYPNFGAGTYTLFTYTGALTDNGLTFGSMPAGYSYFLDISTPGQVKLIVVSALSLTRPANPDVTYDFNNGLVPPGTAISGSAAVDTSGGVGNSGALKLTDAANSQIGVFVVNDFRAGAQVTGFCAALRVRVGGGTAPPADGWSFNWATDLVPVPAFVIGEEGYGSGLTVAFDNFDGASNGDAPSVKVKWGGTLVAKVNVTTITTGTAYADVFINLHPSGKLDVMYDGQTIFNQLPVTGYTPLSGAQFGLAARTGGYYETHWIDDLCIKAFPPPPPAITPSSLTVTVGQSATFTVNATGAGPLTYQWKKNGTPIAGANSATLTLEHVTLGDGGSFACDVCDGDGTNCEGTNLALLTVVPDNNPPTLVSAAADCVNFKVTVVFSELLDAASAMDQFSYAISGGILIQNVVLAADGKTVCLLIDLATPLLPSVTYTLTVNDVTDLAGNTVAPNSSIQFACPPVITTQPQSQTVTQGQTATFMVSATGAEPLFYLWEMLPEGANAYGPVGCCRVVTPGPPVQMTACCTNGTDGLPVASAGLYRVVVMSPFGSVTSDPAMLTVVLPPLPVITAQPQSLTVIEGRNAVFSVSATGAGPLAYQWRKDGTPIPGATSATLTLHNVSVGDDGIAITCDVCDGTNCDITNLAMLTVVPDTDPPLLVSANADCASNKVTVTFNECFDPIGAFNPTNYSINGVTIVGILPAAYTPMLNEDFNAGNGGFTVTTPLPYAGPWVHDAGSGSWKENGQGPYTNQANTSLLDSPDWTVPACGTLRLTFVHRYSFEPDWDGGQVRLSVNGGLFTAVPLAAFSQNGYAGLVLPSSTSFLAGQAAFTAESPGFAAPGYITSVADLGSFEAGDTVRVQFVAASDESTQGNLLNWEIDRVALALADGKTVVLCTDPLALCTTYTLTVSNVTDLAGNTIFPNPTTITFACPATVVCAGDKTVECGSVWSFNAPTSSCANATITALTATTNGTCPVIITQTWSVTFPSGQSNFCSQTVTVVDTTPPMLTCASNKTVDCCASTITFTFHGRVDRLDGPFGPQVPPPWDTVNVGDAWTLTYTFNPLAPDTDPLPFWGIFPGAVSSFSMTAGTASSTPQTVGPASAGISVANNQPAPNDQYNGYFTWTQNSSPVAVAFQFLDATGNAWTSSDTLPRCLNLAGFGLADFMISNGGPSPDIIHGVITNVTCVTNPCVPWQFDVPTVSDACSGTNVSLTMISNTVSGACPRVFTRTWRATDVCSNSATCTQVVTVLDTTPPALTCPTNFSVTCTNPAGANVTYPVTAADQCDTNVSVVCAPPSGSLFPQGATTVQCAATDACGNSNTCAFTVTVRCCARLLAEQVGCDTNGSGNFTYTFTLQNLSGTNASWLFLVPLDPLTLMPSTNCVSVNPGFIFLNPPLASGASQTLTVTLKPLANCGTNVCLLFTMHTPNFEECCSFTHCLTLDAEAPDVTCAPGKTVECDTEWSFDDPMATDACCGTNVSISLVDTILHPPTSCSTSATRTWRITDCAFNSITCAQTVTVVDTTPPVVNCAPDKTIECDAPFEFDEPTALDGCCGTNVTITLVDTILHPATACSTSATRTWRITDCCSNSTICAQTVTTVDTTPPEVTYPRSKTVECGAAVTFDTPTAFDACCGGTVTITVLSDVVPRGVGCSDAFVRTWLITDCCSNSTTVAQAVTVRDTTPPVLTCPAPITKVVCTNHVAVYYKVLVRDCSPSFTLNCVPPSGTVFNAGTTSVACTATDACGNSSSCSFPVTVVVNSPIWQTLPCGINDCYAWSGWEPATPGACLSSVYPGYNWKSFDSTTLDRSVGHTWTFPADWTIFAAQLSTQARPPAPYPGFTLGSDNDSINLGLNCNPANWLWSRYLGSGNASPGLLNTVWNDGTGCQYLVTFDLAALPPVSGPAINLLPYLNSTRRLDLLYQDDTTVDFAHLRVLRCAPSDVLDGLGIELNNAAIVYGPGGSRCIIRNNSASATSASIVGSAASPASPAMRVNLRLGDASGLRLPLDPLTLADHPGSSIQFGGGDLDLGNFPEVTLSADTDDADIGELRLSGLPTDVSELELERVAGGQLIQSARLPATAGMLLASFSTAEPIVELALANGREMLVTILTGNPPVPVTHRVRLLGYSGGYPGCSVGATGIPALGLQAPELHAVFQESPTRRTTVRFSCDDNALVEISGGQCVVNPLYAGSGLVSLNANFDPVQEFRAVVPSPFGTFNPVPSNAVVRHIVRGLIGGEEADVDQVEFTRVTDGWDVNWSSTRIQPLRRIYWVYGPSGAHRFEVSGASNLVVTVAELPLVTGKLGGVTPCRRQTWPKPTMLRIAGQIIQATELRLLVEVENYPVTGLTGLRLEATNAESLMVSGFGTGPDEFVFGLPEISRNDLLIRWTGFGGVLEEATNITGPWTPTPGQFEQTQGEVRVPVNPAMPTKFFRVRGN